MAIDQSEARRQGPDEQQQTIIFYILSAKITSRSPVELNEPFMVSQHEITQKLVFNHLIFLRLHLFIDFFMSIMFS